MLKEFKEFAMKGNIMDLAIGVVIGGAFQKIITSLVEDVIMPCVSMLTGRVDFSDMVINVGDASIRYGNFITAIVNFLIIAFSIFLAVKYINKLNRLKDLGEDLASKFDKKGKLKKHKANTEKDDVVPEPTTKVCPYCLTEINYKATRCPHCTSILDNDEIKTEANLEKQEVEQEIEEEANSKTEEIEK